MIRRIKLDTKPFLLDLSHPAIALDDFQRGINPAHQAGIFGIIAPGKPK